MAPVNNGVTRSKVKAKVTLYDIVKIVSVDYLENNASKCIHISHVD